ncbi:MAG: hypothetical protein ACRYF0_05585 [Janthinobacterium lividum]
MLQKTFDLLDAHFTAERQDYEAMKPNPKFKYSSEEFIINPSYWDKYYEKIKNVIFSWDEIKYDSKIDVTKRITSDDPGIYMFYIRPNNCILDLPKFVLYIGIAGATDALNPLKKRLGNYFNHNNIRKRDILHRLLGKYYNHTYVAFSLLPGYTSAQILELETNLIGFYYPIANVEDFPVEIQKPRKAFGKAI